jgi:signal transduction histidine kinase
MDRSHSWSQQASASASATVAARLDETLGHAGGLAARIATMTLAAQGPQETAGQLAPLLGDVLGAAEIGVFAMETVPTSGRRPRARLATLAMYRMGALVAEPADAKGMALQWAARWALAAACRDRQDTIRDASLRALALGQPRPWAAVVVRWGDPQTAAHCSDLLDTLAPTLALALRPAAAAAPHPVVVDAEGRRATIFTLSSEAILTLGTDLVVREANPASAAITGWPEEALVGRRCADLLRCRDSRQLLLCGTPRCPLSEALAADTPTPPRDLCWETRSGRLCEVSATITARAPAPLAGRRDVVVVARDVTALNAANRVRANFVSMVSHELRTPLNSINGFLDIVLTEQTGPLTPKQHEFLTYAHVSAQQLTTLVEDVLLLSKADAGQFILRLAPVDVAQLAAGAIQIAGPAAQKASVTLHVEGVDEMPQVYGDDLRLSQVLNNLLSNAVKYSDAGSVVTLSARLAGDEVELAVTDAGCGVARDEQARIFERFYQGERAGHRAGGYGLGLAIAKLLIEQHRGRIWVESEPGAGARFAFTVPVAASAAF